VGGSQSGVAVSRVSGSKKRLDSDYHVSGDGLP
jgi:hypothetical protein